MGFSGSSQLTSIDVDLFPFKALTLTLEGAAVESVKSQPRTGPVLINCKEPRLKSHMTSYVRFVINDSINKSLVFGLCQIKYHRRQFNMHDYDSIICSVSTHIQTVDIVHEYYVIFLANIHV